MTKPEASEAKKRDALDLLGPADAVARRALLEDWQQLGRGDAGLERTRLDRVDRDPVARQL